MSGMTPGTKKTAIIGGVVVAVCICAVIIVAMYTGNLDALIEFRNAK